MPGLIEIKEALAHLVFPHICAGCGSDTVGRNSSLCTKCLAKLPDTGFTPLASNPVEKIFWGRLPVSAATAAFYYSKESLLQNLVHQFKYKGHKALGQQLGQLIGLQLQNSTRFTVDAIVPLPLYAAKERKRGYNQALLLCQGIQEIIKKPILQKIIIRPEATATQTRKTRVDRWVNMEGKFKLNTTTVPYTDLLLVDDIITTGATLEACGAELLKLPGIQLSLACLCYTSKI